MNDHDALVDGWLAGQLDEAQRRRLQQQLRDPDRLREFLARTIDERALRDLLCQKQARQTSVRRRYGRWGLAAAALILIGTGLWMWAARGPSQVGRVATVTGRVYRERQGREQVVEAGTILRAQDRLRGEQPASIALVDDAGIEATLSALSADEGFALALSQREHWLLQRGRLAVTVPARASDFAIQTPHATCSVLGTRFVIAVDADGSSVAVTTGAVRWAPVTGASEVVAAGARTSCGLPPKRDLMRWHCTATGIRTRGIIAEAWPLISVDGELRLQDDGLLVERTDTVRSPNPHSHQPLLLQRLQEAEAVILAARIRFVDGVPANMLIANLLCQPAPDPQQRYYQLRWLGDAISGPTGWHTVSVSLHRGGRNVFSVDGTPVHSGRRPWIFASWTADLDFVLHHHEGNGDAPFGIVFDEIWLQVR